MTGRPTSRRRATSEELAFFETLVALRTRYVARGPEDGTPAMSIRHAIAAAVAALGEAASPAPFRLGIRAN